MDKAVKVLVIEDDLSTITLLKAMLKMSLKVNFEVKTVETLRKGFRLLEKDSFDVLILDLNLPDSQGLDTLVEIYKGYHYLPIIITTGSKEEALGVKAISLGAENYLVKGDYNANYLEKTILYSIEHKKRESYIDNIFENMGDALLVLDFEENIKRVNKAATRLLEYSREDLLGKAFVDLWGKEIFQGFDFLSSKEKQELENYETCLKRSDGSLIPVTLSCSAIKDKDKKNSNFVCLLKDISKQKKAEEEKFELERELKQAQKLESIGTLAAGIAHEINTPIQFISDNTEFVVEFLGEVFNFISFFKDRLVDLGEMEELKELKRELKVEEENIDLSYMQEQLPKALEQTVEGLERVKKIVKAMKDFSHIGQGEEKEEADINEAIRTTITISCNEWKYAAELETDLDENLPLVNCFIADIKQVILNLIVNAAHAIEEKNKEDNQSGIIKIKTKKKGKSVIISIEDTGAGIEEKIRDRVFEHFFTTKVRGKGTGQGLAMGYKTVVEKHGGELYFETEAGKGTTFFIKLPI